VGKRKKLILEPRIQDVIDILTSEDYVLTEWQFELGKKAINLTVQDREKFEASRRYERNY